jgi:hypothetical protein
LALVAQVAAQIGEPTEPIQFLIQLHQLVAVAVVTDQTRQTVMD